VALVVCFSRRTLLHGVSKWHWYMACGECLYRLRKIMYFGPIFSEMWASGEVNGLYRQRSLSSERVNTCRYNESVMNVAQIARLFIASVPTSSERVVESTDV
jgi:hypothetical protein